MVKSILIFILLNTLAFSGFCDKIVWKQLPGQFKYVSAKGKEVWAIGLGSPTNVYRLVNNTWQTIPVNARTEEGQPEIVAASQDGWSWMKTDRNVLYFWNLDKGWWDYMPFMAVYGRPAKLVNALWRDSAITVGHPDRDDLVISYINGTWALLKNFSHPITNVAIGENNDFWVHLTKPNDQSVLYELDKLGTIKNTYPIQATSLDVQNKDRIIITSPSGRMYVLKNGRWEQIKTTAFARRAAITRDSVYFVDEEYNIFMANI